MTSKGDQSQEKIKKNNRTEKKSGNLKGKIQVGQQVEDLGKDDCLKETELKHRVLKQNKQKTNDFFFLNLRDQQRNFD